MNRISLRAAVALLALVSAGLMADFAQSPLAQPAQEPGTAPETKPPAPAPVGLKHPDNDYWRKHDQKLLTDFARLARFR